MLVALNELWRTGLTPEELARLGLTLGADVPVFVRGASAWAEGRGEQLTALELPECWYLVLNPGVAVGTAEIFQAPELTRDSPIIKIRDFSPEGAGNVCEPVVRARYPAVAEALDWLSQQLDAHGASGARTYERHRKLCVCCLRARRACRAGCSTCAGPVEQLCRTWTQSLAAASAAAAMALAVALVCISIGGRASGAAAVSGVIADRDNWGVAKW